ncbi:MAG: 2-amino-4-hydroxy-6-hydroxymethyldihydropteridine diphosphokinase [Elusimicrobia bacterium GWC2_64_44]|nr:MAG: 2-amino-4-hydroxy-6-hydroxymethyldihydropteridine diphosphokinase [Elusimicrobia bacterium GWC2_64_44]
MKVYLSLGSNLGDRLQNLNAALDLLGSGGCRLLRVSPVYETAPLYYLKQPAFFNLAAACETELSPEGVLALIGRVEGALKRRRLVRNGPRTVDVDILFYDGRIIDRPGLQVPHPRLAEREFVLAPLADIAPGLRHPATGKTVRQLLAALQRGGARRLPATYAEAEDWLSALPPPSASAHYSLGPVKAALARLGAPEKKMGAVVHIAGSTGKTSSACLTAAALSACGWRTGLYTSPHVLRLRERIKLDGRDIGEEDFLACFLRVQSAAAGELSFFETLTAMAFLYFAQRKARFSVVEAGLGGRLDATNAADGAVAGLTSVSLEHADLIGPGLKEIAAHKAGIIKKGAAVVAGALPPEAARIVGRRAAAAGAELFYPGPAPALPALKMAGAFQSVNAAFALKCAELAAAAAGLKFRPGRALKKLAAALPPGRFQRLVIDGRRVVVDGAHNAEGVAALLKEFKEPPVCVAAFMKDKDAAGLASALASASSRLVLTRSLSYRSADPESVRRLLPPAARRAAEVAADPAKALRRALCLAPRGGTVLVAGSLYLAGDILAGLGGRRAFHPREMLVKTAK